MSDLLATSYLGLPLSGPIIASAGPFTGRLDTLRELEAAGAAAVVLPSLFEEDVVAEEMEFHEFMEVGSDFAEYAGGMLQEVELPDLGSDRHVRLVAEAKAALSVPVIASVNAAWTFTPRCAAATLNARTTSGSTRDENVGKVASSTTLGAGVAIDVTDAVSGLYGCSLRGARVIDGFGFGRAMTSPPSHSTTSAT